MSEERIRRLVLGELKRIYRGRYGVTLPDDDAGRDDLELLLVHVVADKRRHAIEIWSPWISEPQAERMLAKLPATRPSLPAIAERLRLTYAEREAHAVRLIPPVDLTAAELEEHRKAKRRARQAERRRKAGAVTRVVFLATSTEKNKPWEAQGISRRTWYNRRRSCTCTGMKPTRVLGELQTSATSRNGHGRTSREPP